MKRLPAILCAALLLAALAAGCKKEPPAIQLPEPSDDYTWIEDVTLPETETEPVEPTDADGLEPGATAATTKAAATTKTPALSGNASTTRATTTSTARSATTTRSTTTTTTTRSATVAGGISIGSKDAALSAFNSAVKKVIDGKAGFAKSHLITYEGWAFDQGFLDSIPSLGGLVDPASTLSTALNNALGKGMRTATARGGESNNLIKNSALAMGDLKDVTYTGSASGGWTITLTVKDGQTRQEKRLLGSGASGSSPIDKGPLNHATGSGSIYDHMDASRVFALVKDSLSFANADPIDITESTSQVKFVAKLDGLGRLTELKATFNQTINLKEIKILNGLQSFKDNTGSSSVTVTYDAFLY